MAETRAYRSKIGRLPFAIRHELCERIRDGAVGEDILRWINRHPAYRALGLPPVSAQNLSAWRDSGYKDWLRDQDKTDHLRKLAEFADAIASKTGGDPSAVGSRIVAGRLLDVLEAAPADPVDNLVAMFSDLRKQETAARKVDLAARKIELDQQALDLAEQRFRRESCELFLRWAKSRKAMQIADGPGSNETKIKALLAFMDKEQTAK